MEEDILEVGKSDRTSSEGPNFPSNKRGLHMCYTCSPFLPCPTVKSENFCPYGEKIGGCGYRTDRVIKKVHLE